MSSVRSTTYKLLCACGGELYLATVLAVAGIFFYCGILVGLGFSCLASAVSTSPALFAEDGSGRVDRWYYSRRATQLTQGSEALIALGEIAGLHGFALYDTGYDYEWSQDLLVFDEVGAFVAQADLADGEAPTLPWFAGLTKGVLVDETFFNRVGETFARRWVSDVRTMQTTVIEGGALLSGKLRSGEAYVVVDERVLKRAWAHLQDQSDMVLTEAQVRHLVAQDLGVADRRLISLRTPRHLDLLMQLMPGGKALLHDPRLVPPLMDKLLEQVSDSAERERLRTLRDAHRSSLTGGTVNGLLAEYDQMARDLERAGLQVVRVAGDFSELRDAQAPEYGVNFLNGFQGTDANGVHWVVTNRAQGLPSLQNYWASVLREHSLRPNQQRTYFLGNYSSQNSAGAGIDCVGASAGGVSSRMLNDRADGPKTLKTRSRSKPPSRTEQIANQKFRSP